MPIRNRVVNTTLCTICLFLFCASIPATADEPTLARLSFWAPTERMDEFAAAYAEQITPLLKKHGLAASSERGRTTVDSVFARLFSFATPTAFSTRKDSLWDDPAWQDLLQHLGADFRSESESPIRCQFTLYQCPAGAGRQTPAGPGTRRGEWLTFGVQDGLSPEIQAVLSDRDGNLWITGMRDVARYDGENVVTFTQADGLAGDRFFTSSLQDRDGNLWFGTDGGATRYDGESFVTFTAADGLAGDYVISIQQDRNGHLWFGFDAGVTRFDGETFKTFTVQDGLSGDTNELMLHDQDGNLWFGYGFNELSTWNGSEIKGITRYDGKTFKTLTGRDGPIDHPVFSMLQDRHGHLWFGGENRVTRYDGTQSETFTMQDGLLEGRILKIVEDRDGLLWFGSDLKGISRFDGEKWRSSPADSADLRWRSDPTDLTDLRFTTFTTADGLLNDQVRDIVEDDKGYIWVGTIGGGLSRYEGEHFVHFTPSDGLPSQFVYSILQDSTGTMWFGTHGGLVRYDGEDLATFTAKDGLAKDMAQHIVKDIEGNLWIKGLRGPRVTRYDGKVFNVLTLGDSLDIGYVGNPVVDRKGHVWFPASPYGAVCYDGQNWKKISTEDGLLSNHITSLAEDRNGHMWFGGGAGASRYDGESFTSFTLEHIGLKGGVASIGEDQKGHLWFGDFAGSASRYDGETFTAFTNQDGLKSGPVLSFLNDRKGHLWFCIWGGGIVRYDGLVFQDLHHRDGLIADTVHQVYEDRDGDFWIATDSGITRYRPSTKPPTVHLKEAIADRSYGPIRELALPSSQRLVIFTFQGRSFSTPPDRMVYVYRFQGHEDEWQSTRQTEVRYSGLPTGEYLFEVKAVDRDLNYSNPVSLSLTIHPPYRQWTLVGGLCLALMGLVIVSGYAFKKRHDLFVEMEEELQTAHDMQMRLMPTSSPELPGFDIAGRCLPANHVGGDLFQYFPLDDRLVVAMADVTGHAMEAAVPVMMFSGVLESDIGHGYGLEMLFTSLNRTLCNKLDDRTFVCLAMSELDLSTRTFRFANGGSPYPYHFHAATGEVSELQVDAYPLGVRPDTAYTAIEVQLEPGDRIIFYSDGIPEAENVAGDLFGFERTAETIRQGCTENQSAEELIDRLFGSIETFVGSAIQRDDMTCVVMRAE
ncbi:MAG: SpoIIE family protein phosphatase [Gemmatimonadetes bacterium]|jgi:ligand-binding sensor domain-containing protein|nr:SpoIIE family protein phosphatase [Gemmatimonadota bacterium]